MPSMNEVAAIYFSEPTYELNLVSFSDRTKYNMGAVPLTTLTSEGNFVR